MDIHEGIKKALSDFYPNNCHINVITKTDAGAKVWPTKCPECGQEFNCYYTWPEDCSTYDPCGHRIQGPPNRV